MAIPTRVLVLGMQRPDGTIDASELYDVADAAGMSMTQVRLCLRRLTKEGRLVQKGRGRSAVFSPGRSAGDTLPELELLRFAYEQDAGRAPWDGMWHLVGFNVPERSRAARDEFRDRLLFLGGALVHGGLYVSPNPWEPLVESEAARLGVRDTLTVVRTRELSVGGIGGAQRLAARLWPIENLDADYRRFVIDLRQRLDDPDAEASVGNALPAVFRTVLEFSAIAERDPLLPPELLPPEWSGSRARAALNDAAARLRAQADAAQLPAVVRLLTDPEPASP